MLEVMFNDSEKGCLKYAQRLGGGISHNDIAGLSFGLDMGDISGPLDGGASKTNTLRIFTDRWNEHGDLKHDIEAYWQYCLADLDRLMDAAKKGEPIRVWYSDAPYSLCGFLNVIALLEGCSSRISAIKLPRFLLSARNTVTTVSAWSDVTPDNFVDHLSLEQVIPKAIRATLAQEWQALVQENAPLRAVISGAPQSVGIDFYDGFIRRELPICEITVAQLVGRVLGKNRLGIGDWFIALRIRAMIDTGELAVDSEDDAFYRTVVYRT